MALIYPAVTALDPARFRNVLGPEFSEVERAIGRAPELFRGRVIWHVNSTEYGGGVAELLQSLLGYARGVGVDARRVVITGPPEFFETTKRIHNHLHGWTGDGGELGEAERELIESVAAQNSAELATEVRPGDIVFCHDPQTAAMVPHMLETGATVIWRCHVGIDHPNGYVQAVWDFLRPWVLAAHAHVFSRREFVWEGLDPDRVWIVPPSIDAFSPKNQELTPGATEAIVSQVGLAPPDGRDSLFVRVDGTPGRVDRHAEIDQDAPIPAGAPLVAQVSRWDRLKDPVGVLTGFAEHCHHPDAHLLLAGPAVAAVADDPEAAEVLAEMRALRMELPPERRAQVHLACLPMDDVEENAAIVNALQRRANVIVQKSLAEGFGLTVAEAMWKRRPVVASKRGGIQDQIAGADLGVLLDDPTDLEAYGRALDGLLADPARAERIGAAARAWVRDNFLGSSHLVRYMDLIDDLVGLSRA
jgi:trehalose synthase